MTKKMRLALDELVEHGADQAIYLSPNTVIALTRHGFLERGDKPTASWWNVRITDAGREALASNN